MTASERVAAAAEALVGARFRLHGRDPATGLDCVGVAAAAFAAGGDHAPVPTGYAIRGGDPDAVAALLDVRLRRIDRAEPGALLLGATGPGQLHLAIAVAGGIVHADAALRRVVRRPGSSPWPVLGCWHLKFPET